MSVSYHHIYTFSFQSINKPFNKTICQSIIIATIHSAECQSTTIAYIHLVFTQAINDSTEQ